MRHGYGVRSSAPFGMASHNKLSENRMASMTSLNQVCSHKLGLSSASLPFNSCKTAKDIKKMWKHFKNWQLGLERGLCLRDRLVGHGNSNRAYVVMLCVQSEK